MWIVEINILGRRFTHRTPDRLRSFAVRPKAIRVTGLRGPRAA